MPTPEEVADNLKRFGEASPFYAQVEEDARRAATQALAAQRRFDIEQTGQDPFQTSPEQMQIVYMDYLRRARAARSLPTAPRMAEIASVATPEGVETETGILGGLKKGVQAGAMRVGALTASPFLDEESSMVNFAAANKRGSEVEGLPAEISATIAQTGTEMAPLVAGSLLTGGAVVPALGAGAGRTAALGAASVGAGLQSGVPEYFERRAQGMDEDQAKRVALAKGLGTATVTAAFGLRGVEALANPAAARQGVKSLLQAAGRGAGSEAIEEATDEVFQAFVDRTMAGDNVTLGDFVERAVKAGLLGALFGGAGEVVAEARDRIGGLPATPADAPARAGSAPVPQPATAAPTTPQVSTRNAGIAMRNVMSGALDPATLSPDGRALIAQTIRNQLPAGAPVPPQIQTVLAKLEAQGVPSVPAPQPAVGTGGQPGAGVQQPTVAPAPAQVRPGVVPPVAQPAAPPRVPAGVRGTAAEAPAVAEPARVPGPRPIESTAPAVSAVPAASTPQPATPVAPTAPEPAPAVTPATPVTPTPAQEPTNAVPTQEVRQVEARQEGREEAPVPAGQEALIRKPSGDAEKRLREGGMISREDLAERQAAAKQPPVDTQAPTERIVRQEKPDVRGQARPESRQESKADASGVEGAPAGAGTPAPAAAPAERVPERVAGRRPFDVSEDPASPTYVNRIRERVSEAIGRKRKAGGTELRPGPDRIKEELGETPTPEVNARVAEIVRKNVVSKARVNGRETTLYETPNGWGRAINEYADLFRKHGRVVRAEMRHREADAVRARWEVQLSELPADAPADQRNRVAARLAKATAAADAARSKLTSARSGKNPPSERELARLRELSAGIRAQMGESIAKQAAELIRQTPAERRAETAARIEQQIETGSMPELVSDELVDPASLSGVNSRVFLADVDGKFALVAPHPKRPGEYITLNRAGEKSATDPFVTDQLGELLDSLSANDLSAPAVAQVEGLHTPIENIRAGQRGTPQPRDAGMAPKDWESAEQYLNRLLLTDTNGDVDASGRAQSKSVDASQLEAALAKFPDGQQILSEYVRIKAIKKEGGKYVSQPMGMFYRKKGPAMTGATGDADPSNDEILSEQKQIELAGTLFDLDVRTGMRHGIEMPKGALGVYDMNARSIALGQFDLETFFHELFHDVTLAEIGKRSTPMPAVQRELVAVARATGQPALMSEGAAELGSIYVRDPDAARRAYPTATKWMENVLATRGMKERVDSIVAEHQKWLKATPEQRRKAAIISKQELADKDKTQALRSPWAKVKTFLSTRLFDRVANLRAVSRELPPPKDSMDDAYESKMLEAGWPKAAADSFINGYILDPRSPNRTASFGGVMDRANQLGLTPEQFTDWQAYMAGMSVFDKSPRIRRRIFKKLGIDEAKHGIWAIPDAYLPDPFDTVDEIIAANQQMELDWEAKAALNKKLGKPAPPKPVPYKVQDPTPGSSSDAPTNFTEAQLEDFARIIQKHDVLSEFHQLADAHMEAVNARDDWRLKNGLITRTQRASHRNHAYYVPMRTETADGARIKIKGSGGAEIIAPYEQLWDKVRTDHFYLYSQGSPRAWLRYITGIRADRIAAGTAADEAEFPLAKLASFTSMDEAIRNYASISAKIKRTGQESPVVDEYVIVSLDEPTIEALMAANLINPLLVSDPKSLVGTHIAYRVEDPEIRSALGDPSIPWTPALHWIFRGPAQVLRKLATVFNPEFWVKTVVRDTYQAVLQTATGRLRNGFLGGTGKGVVDAYTNASNLASDRAKTDPIYAQFVQSGVTSSSLLADAGNVTSVLSSHDLSRALSMMGAHKPKFGWLRNLASPLSRVADTVEGFNRAGEFRRSVGDSLAKLGKSKLDQVTERQARSILIDAARAAQEVTVNFRRMGSWSPIRTLNDMVPFFNATIQGSIRGLKTVTFQARYPGESAGKRLVNGATVYTLLALPVLLQHLFLDDPEERDQYAELPDAERMLFYHFPVGRDASGKVRFVRIPKPQGAFAGVVAAMEKMAQDDPRTWTEIAHDTFEQITPQSYIPTSLQLGIELFSGQRLGATAGRGMTPYRLQGVEGDAQDAPWLSPSSYAIADGLQALGWKSASPLMVENLIRGYTGGLGWTVMDVPPAIQDLVGKHDRASYDPGSYPLTRLFITRDPGFASRSITRVYDLLDVLNAQRKTYDQEIRRAELGQQTPDEAVANILSRPMTGFGKQADEELADFREKLGKARTLWESINRDQTMDPIQRRIEMDKIVEQIVDASRLVYDTITKIGEQETGKPLKVPRR